MQIYVIIGTTGEYSGRSVWVVCSYQDEIVAQQHVIAAQKEASIICKAINDLDWGDFIEFDNNESKKAKLLASNVFDTNMEIDPYTGVSYYYNGIDMLTELPKKD